MMGLRTAWGFGMSNVSPVILLDSLIIKYQARRWDSARTAAPEKKAASVKRQASVAVTR